MLHPTCALGPKRGATCRAVASWTGGFGSRCATLDLPDFCSHSRPPHSGCCANLPQGAPPLAWPYRPRRSVSPLMNASEVVADMCEPDVVTYLGFRVNRAAIVERTHDPAITQET